MDERQGLFRGRAYLPLVFLCYFGLFAALFPDVLLLGNSFAKRDILRFYYPVWKFSVQCLGQGILPLWNPYTSYGTPLFADIQTCVLYPMSLILHLPDYLLAFNLYILTHLALAGFFTCLWMRDCGASREAAFLSGLALGLSGYVMSAINLTISLCSLVYFPLVLLCLRRAFHGKGLLWKALGAVTLLFQYLAGDPAILFSTLVVCCLFTFFKTAAESVRRKELVFKYAFDFAATLALFLGLSAFHTLLFAEFLSHSNRANPTFEDVTVWSMRFSDLFSFVFPFFSDNTLYFMDYWTRQSWLENYYAGITVVLLGGLAWRLDRRNLVGYHVLLAIFGVALAMGRFCYIHRFLYDWFPFFKYIRYPVRFSYLTYFALACLAGFGLDALLARLKRPEAALTHAQARFLSAGVALLAGAIVATMVLSPWVSAGVVLLTKKLLPEWTPANFSLDVVIDLVQPILQNVKRSAALIAFLGAGVLAALYFKPRRQIVSAFILLLVFTDLSETNNVEVRLDGRFLEKISRHMDVLIKDGGIFRAQAGPSAMLLQLKPMPLGMSFEAMLEILQEALCPNMLLPHRVAYTSGYDSIYLMRPLELNGAGANIRNPAEYRYLNMMNIKYVVSRQEELDETYRRIQHAGPTYLYENERVLPRAFLVARAQKGPSGEEMLSKVVSKDFDPLAQIYLEEEPPALPRKGPAEPPPGGEERVRITRYAPNEVRMDVSSRSPQWLFFSDVFYPGWKALVNGRPVKIYRANYVFRAIAVPEGLSEVKWMYDPILFKIGCAVSALTALGLLACFRRRRNACPR